MQFSHLHSNIC